MIFLYLTGRCCIKREAVFPSMVLKSLTESSTHGSNPFSTRASRYSSFVLLEGIYEVFRAFESIPQIVQDRLVNELRKVNENEVEYHKKEISRIQSEYNKT